MTSRGAGFQKCHTDEGRYPSVNARKNMDSSFRRNDNGRSQIKSTPFQMILVLFHLERLDAETQMLHIAKGLAKLCAEIEQGKFNKKTIIYGATYYFNNATLQRFGFRVRKQTLFEKFIFGLNYLELCLLFSISRRKLSFVNTDLVKVAYCPLERLVQNKADYERIAARLSPGYHNRLVGERNDALAA